ncbi:hypothetical protein FGU71_02545 [Erythrobacter insulae]|uniref:Uncharacterized protein n=1 Tax=Erythrobacter insulae TaxID=2584124 RepID=A0A547P9N7_9SPHN|nr:hypothetical protein [Erythrobacter insulae]TRD10855.1 hypothetical protein FGU71_02545 [Erythrobacter insulae]
MHKYSVMIEGVDFPARLLEDADGPLGFYATRFVEATDEQAAEFAALDSIKKELRPFFRERRNGGTNPLMFVHKVVEIKELPDDAPGSGATWFEMDS